MLCHYQQSRKTQTPPSPIPGNSLFDFAAMDILGLLSRTTKVSHHIVITTDLYSKLTRVVPIVRMSTNNVAKMFFTAWVFPYDIPTIPYTDNGTQFVSKLIEELHNQLGTMHLTATAYQLKINCQAERNNKTAEDLLRHIVANRQQHCDLFVQPLTFAYNAQLRRSNNTTSFISILSR